MDKKPKVAEKVSPVETVLNEPGIARESVISPLVTYPIEVVIPKARQQTPAVGQRATRLDGRLHGLGQTRLHRRHDLSRHVVRQDQARGRGLCAHQEH